MNYQKIYDDFIKSRLNRPKPEGYFEKHHIVPRALGGSDDKSNIIALSAKEHFFAHLLLAKIHGGLMWHVLNLMRNRVSSCSSKKYAFLRERFSKEHSRYLRARYSSDLRPWNEGMSYSREHREKLSKAHTGKVLSAEHREKVLRALSKRSRDAEWSKNISMSLKGHSVSKSTREKISKSLLGNIPHNKGVADKKVKCPHCGKEGGRSIMKRWHFENCKNKLPTITC